MTLTSLVTKISSFSLPGPDGRGLFTQLQSQPFHAFMVSYQFVPQPERPSLLSLPPKQPCAQSPVQKSHVTQTLSGPHTCPRQNLSLGTPRALTLPYHSTNMLNSWLSPAPTNPPPSLLLEKHYTILCERKQIYGVDMTLSPDPVGTAWIPVSFHPTVGTLPQGPSFFPK